MRVRRLDHIGIAVRSLEEAVPVYEALGLRMKGTEEVPGEQVRVAVFPLGESRIELLEATSPESPIARFLEKRPEGIHHVALEVEDLEAACAELRADGVRITYDAPRKGEGGAMVNFVHPDSAHGVLLELREERGD